MIRGKSFKLSRAEKTPNQSEGLYQPKYYRWCKYIVVPLLIAFILLLILMNVDFSGKAYQERWLIENHVKVVVRKRSEEAHIPRPTSQARDFKCIQGPTSCILICRGRNTNNIYKDLEPLYPLCGNTTELYLYDSNFPSGAMKPMFLEGSFRLKTLAIIDCNLNSIEANAFQHDSVSTLKNLYLINTRFGVLSSTTFEGLLELEVLNITNQMSVTTFKGNQFLKPLANTLRVAKMEQETKADVAYDPLAWLAGSEMRHLKEVDLRNNNFPDKLTGKTFANLNNVEVLNLANCSMSYLPADVFDGMLATLHYLDLSMNHFATLEMELIRKLGNLKCLNLSGNEWNCSCDNTELLEILKHNCLNPIDDMATPKCFTPLEMKGKNITEIVVKCQAEASTFAATSETESSATYGNWNSTGVSPTTALVSDTTDSADDASEPTECGSSTAICESTTEVIDSTTTSHLPSTSDSSTTTTQTHITTTTEFPIFTSTTYTSSTTPHPLFGSIACRDFNREDTITIDLMMALTKFTISFHSETSVGLTLSQDHAKFDLIYFSNSTDAANWTYRSITQRRIDYTLVVYGLEMGTAYVFCFAAKNRLSISPFDCKSHFVQLPKAEQEAWLQSNDQAWIIALVVVGACICLFLGIIVIFTLLCLRNRRKLKRKILRNQMTLSPGYRSDSGSSYISGQMLEVSLTDLGTLALPPQLQSHQPDGGVGCPQMYGGTILDKVQYEEMIM